MNTRKKKTGDDAPAPSPVLFESPVLTVELQRQAEDSVKSSITRCVGGRDLIDAAFLGNIVTGDRVAEAHRKVLDVVDPEWRKLMCVVGTPKSVGYVLHPELEVTVSLRGIALGAKKRPAKRAKAAAKAKAGGEDVVEEGDAE